jgi:micrococcal nuclease
MAIVLARPFLYDTNMALRSSRIRTRSSRRRRRSPLAIAVALLALLAFWLARDGARWVTAPPAEGQWRHVVRVVDGDTLLLDRKERVRLIGVDTPETVYPERPVEYFGREASEFTRRMAEGRRVRLAFDHERTDRYGRTLAYVYLEDGTLLNAEIIRQGYGFAYTQFPFRYLEEFRQLEREAREAGRGLWAEGP